MNDELLIIPAKKRAYNAWIFSRIAAQYSCVCKALSLGRDSVWKRALINTLHHSNEDLTCVDLACGTGDVTFLLAERFPKARIIGVDLTKAMLVRAHRNNNHSNVEFIRQDMCDLKLPDRCTDIVTGSYAIRNAPDLETVLKETNRILKPDGVAAFLDFSKPPSRFVQLLEYLFLKVWCSLFGLILHAKPGVYGYIADSLRHFPNRDQLCRLFNEHGFEVVKTRSFFLGVIEIVLVRKA